MIGFLVVLAAIICIVVSLCMWADGHDTLRHDIDAQSKRFQKCKYLVILASFFIVWASTSSATREVEITQFTHLQQVRDADGNIALAYMFTIENGIKTITKRQQRKQLPTITSYRIQRDHYREWSLGLWWDSSYSDDLVRIGE